MQSTEYGWVKVQKFGVRLLEGLALGVRSDYLASPGYTEYRVLCRIDLHTSHMTSLLITIQDISPSLS